MTAHLELSVDDPDYTPVVALPAEFLDLRDAHPATSTLNRLFMQFMLLAAELGGIEHALRIAERNAADLRPVRAQIRHAIAGWEHHVLVGLDDAMVTLLDRPTPATSEDIAAPPPATSEVVAAAYQATSEDIAGLRDQDSAEHGFCSGNI